MEGPYDYRTARSPELRRRLRRTAWIAVTVVILMVIGAIIYISFWGGANKGPMQPLHSSTPSIPATVSRT
jgi:hypothetical protein